MRKMLALAAVVSISIAVPMEGSAQDAPVSVPVEEIRLDPTGHVGLIRRVDGVVDRLVSRGPDQLPAFYLEDDFGHQILVTPFSAVPSRGDRVSVVGVISLDDVQDPILAVFEEGGISTDAIVEEVPPPAPTPTTQPVTEPVATESPTEGRIEWWMYALGGGVLAALVGFAFLRGRASVGPDIIVGPPRAVGEEKKQVDIATSALWPDTDQEFEGRTLRFIRPDPTLMLMPTKLEVVKGGDEGQEIRFIGGPDEDVEMMFGRARDDSPYQVQLKQQTVSRTHAVIRRREGAWFLENLSMTNPTMLNSETLGVKEQQLAHGDLIEMGEVMFRFVHGEAVAGAQDE